MQLANPFAPAATMFCSNAREPHAMEPGDKYCGICRNPPRAPEPQQLKLPVLVTLKCRKCQGTVTAEAKFCSACGEKDPLAPIAAGLKCEKCAKPMEPHDACCGNCGHSAGSGQGKKKKCGECSEPMEPEDSYCPKCGTQQPSTEGMPSSVALSTSKASAPVLFKTPQHSPATPVQQASPVTSVTNSISCPRCQATVLADESFCGNCSASALAVP